MEAPREKLLPDAEPARTVPAWRLAACHAAMLLATVLTGLGLVLLKRAMNVAAVDSVTFCFWRFAGSAPLLLIVAAATRSQHAPTSLRDVAWFAVLGSLLVFNQLFSNLGVKMAGALIAACMIPLTPPLTALLAVAVGQERLSLRVFAGITIAAGGAVVMAAGRGSGGGQQGLVLRGFASLATNNTAFAAYLLCMKNVVHKHGAFVVTGAAQAFGLLAMAGVVTARQALGWAPTGLWLPHAAFGALAFWVLGISVFSYLLISKANSHLPASTVSLYAVLQPVVGAVLSALLLGEAPIRSDLGVLGIVFGMVLVVVRP